LDLNEKTRIALLLGVSLLVYANTLANRFVYDDEIYVFRNPDVIRPTLTGLFEANKFVNVFRPVTFATFALNWAVGGPHPFGFHLINVCLHAAVVLLLYLVLRTLLDAVQKGKTIALVAALLYAAHPIHTEAVAWVTGRSELLAAGFLQYQRPIGCQSRRWNR
jgi:protein O-mannosyl-transferase